MATKQTVQQAQAAAARAKAQSSLLMQVGLAVRVELAILVCCHLGQGQDWMRRLDCCLAFPVQVVVVARLM
jgi:hypothetical protein